MAEERPIDWEDYIVADPEVMVGKAVVKGTRIAAEFVLQLLAAGWTEAMVLESYPSITPDAMRAIYAFAAQVVGEQRFFGVPRPARPRGEKGGRDAPPRR
jgi:uncharacterized protein (DUF433 family)